MSTTKPPSDRLLARAAEMRAEGNSWKVVAEDVHRSPETVRKWPQLYRERWLAALRDADRHVIADAAAEGLCVLRQIIRSKDDVKVRALAAWHLINQRLELAKLEQKAEAQAAPPPSSEAQLIAAFVEGHTREQLIQLAANLLDARVPKCVVVPSDAAAGGS